MPPFDIEQDSPRLLENIEGLLHEMRDRGGHRDGIGASELCSWHQRLLSDLDPRDHGGMMDSAVVGRFRTNDVDAPASLKQPVEFGPVVSVASTTIREFRGASPHEVRGRVDRLLAHVERKTRALDARADVEGAQNSELRSDVMALASCAHTWLIDIHPFVNGNGRVARLLANYVLVRFGIYPGVSIRPRPPWVYYQKCRTCLIAFRALSAAEIEESCGHAEPLAGVFRDMIGALISRKKAAIRAAALAESEAHRRAVHDE